MGRVRPNTWPRFWASNVKELIWIYMLLRSIGIRVQRPCVVYEDNSAAIKIANNATAIKRTKHIDV